MWGGGGEGNPREYGLQSKLSNSWWSQLAITTTTTSAFFKSSLAIKCFLGNRKQISAESNHHLMKYRTEYIFIAHFFSTLSSVSIKIKVLKIISL